MSSVNFNYLNPPWKDLAVLGGFAEQYVHTDPESAVIKLRTFTERLVNSIYNTHDLPKPLQPTLIDLLNNDVFRQIVPKVVLDKLHAVRIHGNKAAHGEKLSQQIGLWLLKETHDLSRWFYLYSGGNKENCPIYNEPPVGGISGESKSRLKKAKKEALQELAKKEAQLDTVLKELELLKSKTGKTRVQTITHYSVGPYSEVHDSKVLKSVLPKDEIKFSRSIASLDMLPDSGNVKRTGQEIADELSFNEDETRSRLIDSQLVAVGWDVGVNGSNTEEVGQEVPVEHQPTKTGMGAIDYVLWDDNGKPLAVVEAKKTSINAEKGRTQAKLYADGLEKMTGQRPIIFYTNGFDIWIWDDAQNYPPRKLFGFYSKDSLQYLLFQRDARKDLNTLPLNNEIAGRLYQIEAIKQICERFSTQRRKSLVVQATGSGKTRVAVSLTELLIRAGWIKRVLFLCDRRELRKQAKNVFTDFLNEPLVVVGAKTAHDRDKRIYLATYPAMMKIFQTFDVGFFDLIIADESHRSIYNVYGDLFQYFDCLHLGLTATPVEFVSRNTYQLFDCENQKPTAYYPFERAVSEGYLVPFEVQTFTTDFLRRGIKYDQLSEEQRQELEESGEDPELFDYEVKDMDKNIYNKDTGRHIIRNLMENGIRDAEGQNVGKSIIFARNHKHAVQLSSIFDELYPQYGGKFCHVIDNYDPRAEQLIDDFKEPDNELTIAISIDMLDTGIDIPEVVNLVFAKPIYSKVKFWQMIGRGTRLCKNLFGSSKDKQEFYIFDHWGNFDYFDFHYKVIEPTQAKSLMQMVFEARIDLADTALETAEPDFFKDVAKLIEADINALPKDSISVREKWKQKRELSRKEILEQWDKAVVIVLRSDIAPLMQWRNIRGFVDAYELDLLIAQMQKELLHNSGRFEDYKIILMEKVNNLQMHLNPVREKAKIIKQVRSNTFWKDINVQDLEKIRSELRMIIHHRQKGEIPTSTTKIVDITEDVGRIESGIRHSSIFSVDMKIYQKQVEEVLTHLFETDPVLIKIRRGEPVTQKELENLTSLVLTQNPDVQLNVLKDFYENALPLDYIIRSIVGMEPDSVKERFEVFLHKHPAMNAKQTRFLSLLLNHITKYGAIEIERLYEDPFTVVDTDGIDGVFNDDEANELINIITSFNPSTAQETTQK